MIYEGQVLSEITEGEVRDLSKRYAEERQTEAEAAERRALRAAEVLEQVTVVLKRQLDPWGTMKCMICGASVEGVLRWFRVPRVPHAEDCPAFVLSMIVREAQEQR